MPTLLRAEPYRFHFYAGDHDPPHVHVESAGAEAVFSLNPTQLIRNWGYTRPQVREIERLMAMHGEEFLRRWHEHFDE